jgi:hypothetical protein
MKAIVCALMILTTAPAIAQDAIPLPPTLPQTVAPEDKGIDLMEEGAKLLFRGLMGELEPMFDGMGKALEEMQPALQDLIALVDDIRNYDAPRILENGDILIPRRKGAPPPLALPPATSSVPEGEIEL